MPNFHNAQTYTLYISVIGIHTCLMNSALLYLDDSPFFGPDPIWDPSASDNRSHVSITVIWNLSKCQCWFFTISVFVTWQGGVQSDLCALFCSWKLISWKWASVQEPGMSSFVYRIFAQKCYSWKIANS